MSSPENAAPPARPEPLADHLARNVNVVTEMHLEAERGIGAHQRAVERATAILARPASLYVIIAFVALWLFAMAIPKALGLGPFEAWPFDVLVGVIGLAALLVATMVLITQNGQAQASERHARLDLQLNLLTEQKVTKVLELLEELRRDLPNVRNREDASVELLVQPTATEDLIAALAEQMPQAVREAIAEERAEERAEEKAATREEPGT
jgi:uncharacterized membrane protein